MTDEELVKQLRDEALDLHRSAWRDISGGGQNATISATLADTTADRIEQLTAERDRYRKALEGLMVHEPDYSDTLRQDAREALNGETP